MVKLIDEKYWIAEKGEDLCNSCERGTNDSVYSKCLFREQFGDKVTRCGLKDKITERFLYIPKKKK